MQDINSALAITSLLVLAGVLASIVSARLGVPALLLFLGVGMLAGSDGPGGIDFEDYELAQAVGVVALAYILFAGGLDTSWRAVRPVLREGLLLATVGVVTTALVSGAIAAAVLDLPIEVGFLLGAIMCSTDAAAVFSVLRSRDVRLPGRLRSLLELESGSNDPMAVFLTIGLLELVTAPDTALISLVPLFAAQMAVGAVVGFGGGYLAVQGLNRLRLQYEGLYPVMTLATVLATYSVAALLQGSGFLAVYIAGLYMAEREFLHRRSLMRFHDAFAWLSQIGMFLVLGLLVFPSDLPGVALEGLAVSAGLILVARPVGVALSLLRSRMSRQERVLVAWVGLRGAVPVILATFPLVEGIDEAEVLFNTVFFVVLTSVLVQGTTIPFVARRLGVLDTPARGDARPAPPPTGPEGQALYEITVPTDSVVAGRPLVVLGIPTDVTIALVTRDGEFFVPQGASELRADDALLVVATEDDFERLRDILEDPGPPDAAPRPG